MHCPTCEDSLMETDIHGTETTLVCKECGYMATGENQSFSSDLVHDDVLTYSKNETSLNVKYKTDIDKDERRIRTRAKTRYKYILAMKTCMQNFTPNSMAFEDARNIFESMAHNEMFLRKKEKCKMMLAAGCVFHALRRHQMSVTVLAVCGKMGVQFHGMSKILRSISNETEPVVRFDDSGIRAIISEYNTMKNHPTRIDKAMQLLKLLESMSMTIGRRPHTIALTVAYLAYVCEQKTKMCTSMLEFIKINNLGLNNSNDVIVEVKRRIILMVKRLPWVDSEKIAMKRYHKYIDDILPNHDSLLLLPATALTNEEILIRQTNNQEYESNDVPVHINPKTDLDVLNNTWNRRQEKEPQAVKHYPTASNSNILTENDLPESDINLYIRSNEEVEKIKKIKEKLDFAFCEEMKSP